MGITSVRASCARDAERIIRASTIHIAVVDLSLPIDRPSSHSASPSITPESVGGSRVLELLRRMDAPPPTVVLKDPHFSRLEARHIQAALACDAFAVVDRAAADIELMLKVMMRLMQRFYRDRWPSSSFPPPPPHPRSSSAPPSSPNSF